MMLTIKKYAAVFIGILASTALSCNTKHAKPALFELVKNSGIVFINTVNDNDTINILNYRNFYNGGGVAIGDLNNDGLPDVFFTAIQVAIIIIIKETCLRAVAIIIKSILCSTIAKSKIVIINK